MKQGIDAAVQGGATPTLQPRPRLFLALFMLLALWVAALLLLYFTTV